MKNTKGKNNLLSKKSSFLNNDNINLDNMKDNVSLKINKMKKETDNIFQSNNKKYENNSETLQFIIKEEVERARLPTKNKEKIKNINLFEKIIPDIYNWDKLLLNSIPIDRYFSTEKYNKKFKIYRPVTEKENKSQIKKENKMLQTTIPNKNNYKENNSTLNLNKSTKNNENNYKKNSKKTDNIVDYKKGINILCQLPNESLNNYYATISEKRKKAPELAPRLKMKNQNLQNEIKIQRVLSFNKEIKLNVLLSEELEKDNFKNEDLIIAAKRKNADILIKNYDKNNKKFFKTLKSYDNLDNIKKNKNIFRKGNKRKNKGLILSFYDENNPYLKIFDDIAYRKSVKNKNTEKEDYEIIKPTLKRNFFSALNLNINNFSNFNIYNEIDKDNKYDSSERKSYRKENNRRRIQLPNHYFKNNETPKSTKNPNTVNGEEENKNISKNENDNIKRPMSSYNLKSKVHKKYGFAQVNINENKSNFSEEQKTLNYIQSFPRKLSSKVGNIIYDKINKMIKSKSKKNLKLKLKKNNFNYNYNYNDKRYIKLSSKINYIYKYENSEDSKNNKIIPKYENLEKNINNKGLSNIKDINNNYYIFEDDYKYENIKNKINFFDTKLILKNIKKSSRNPFSKNNQIGNNYFSCSNNYIVNTKRKNKNKYLKDYSDSPSLNEVLAELLFDDKFTQENNTDGIKATNHK